MGSEYLFWVGVYSNKNAQNAYFFSIRPLTHKTSDFTTLRNQITITLWKVGGYFYQNLKIKSNFIMGSDKKFRLFF